MHPLSSLRRLALAATFTGAAIGAVPALADASSSCLYNGVTKNLSVVDASGSLPLRIARSDQFIVISDGTSGPSTTCGGSNTIAQVGNTDRIEISGPVTNTLDGYVIDLSGGPLVPGFTPESDGNSEIEVVATTDGGVPANLTVEGGPQHDNIRVGPNGAVDLGEDIDRDPDITITGGASSVFLRGNGGDDDLSGQGFGTGNPTIPLALRGGIGNDRLEGGSGRDTLRGEDGDDKLFAIDTSAGDVVIGGNGVDKASADSHDLIGDTIEQLFVLSVGRLRLSPATVKAEAGGIARLRMSWKHPKAWRELREVQLRAYRGTTAVGTVTARPARGRLSSTGAIDLMPDSTLSHHGKWVTAKLALRVPKSLAGKTLRVDVRAIDRQGREQVERGAGTVRVAA